MQRSREITFAERLWQIQSERALSDSALARALGVHYSLISHVKAGRKALSERVMFAAARQFPELAFFLAYRLTEGTGRIPTVTNGADGAP